MTAQRLTEIAQVAKLKQPSHVVNWALLDLADHGFIEAENGKWIDRHGYMRATLEAEKRNTEITKLRAANNH